MPKFKWTVEIEIDETWVADGVDLTDERMHDIMTRAYAYAYSHEIRCKVIARPDMVAVNEAQGYPFDYQREGWPKGPEVDAHLDRAMRGRDTTDESDRKNRRW